MKRTMLDALAQNWWLLLLRGLAAIVFGILCLLFPRATLLTLAIFYGVYAFVDGIFALTAAFTRRVRTVSTWWLIAVGILGIAAGIIAFLWPRMTALILLFLIASWAIVRGVFEIAGAIQLRKEIRHEWLLILNGILSILFGVLVLVAPGPGALALMWLIGMYAITMGAVLVAFSLRLRHFKHEIELPHPHPR